MIKKYINGSKIIMQAPSSRKEENHNTLCEELLRERAAVLSRAGNAVEDVIMELKKLDHQILLKNRQLKSLRQHKLDQENLDRQQSLLADINLNIEQFNAVRKIAQLKYYYLIVTREALGLRRHDMIQEIYPIPVDKKEVQVY
jgi:hypothetical protein